jgi:hypothetical protein
MRLDRRKAIETSAVGTKRTNLCGKVCEMKDSVLELAGEA